MRIYSQAEIDQNLAWASLSMQKRSQLEVSILVFCLKESCRLLDQPKLRTSAASFGACA
jgi:hypothetical protein